MESKGDESEGAITPSNRAGPQCDDDFPGPAKPPGLRTYGDDPLHARDLALPDPTPSRLLQVRILRFCANWT